MNTMQNAIDEIVKERQRQDDKWGEQNHAPHFWSGILGEEFGELCEAINETVFSNGPDMREKGGYENMRTEAVHVAAVAVGFLECLERNRKFYTTPICIEDGCPYQDGNCKNANCLGYIPKIEENLQEENKPLNCLDCRASGKTKVCKDSEGGWECPNYPKEDLRE